MKEIKSLQNPLIKHLVKLRKNRDYRNEHQSILIEGRQLISEVCAKYPPKVLITTDPTVELNAQEKILVTKDVMNKISGVETAEGLIAEVIMPLESTLETCNKILVLDGLSDPGNVGTLLRSALAFGFQGVFLLENCCDIFNDKAIRSSRAAPFYLPFATGSWEKLKGWMQKNKWRPFAADLTGIPPEQIKEKQLLLVIGNEAHGISFEAEDICEKVSLPMSNKVESLNAAVAGSILMYLLK